MYRFRIYPSKSQEKRMVQHLWLAKNLWNDLLEHSKETYLNFGKFPTRNSLQLMVKNSGMYSQTAQEIAHRVEAGIWRYVKMRKAGHRNAGFPRFKNIDGMKSLHYPQSGFSLEKKFDVTPFGVIQIVRHREILGTIKTLTLKKEASGKWFACFAVEETQTKSAPNGGLRVGIDLGLENLATFSDGHVIKNPRHISKHQEKIVFLRRESDKKTKGSKNRRKANRKVAIEFERLKNKRRDFLHKLSHDLVNSYSFIALEDLASQELAQQNFGKQINDAAWGELASMLRYKAESAGCEVVFVNPKDTTKTCCICGNIKEMTLADRVYKCPICKNQMHRDRNAAYNTLQRATAGMAGSNACRDVPVGTSKKQEIHSLRALREGIPFSQDEKADASRRG